MSGYELFYASGGHFGPFETFEEANKEAKRRLVNQPGVYGNRIEVRTGTTPDCETVSTFMHHAGKVTEWRSGARYSLTRV